MTVDLSGARMFDVHAHPFLNRGAVTPDEFVELTGFGSMFPHHLEEGGVEGCLEAGADGVAAIGALLDGRDPSALLRAASALRPAPSLVSGP